VIKPPFLLCLNFRTSTINRYVRRNNMVVAGLGWELSNAGTTGFDPALPILADALEYFRVSGH